MNKNVCAIVAVVCSAILSGACAQDESSGVTGGDGGGVSASVSSSSGTGGEVPAIGKSPAIEAFQASRRAAHQSPAEIAAIDAQTATASMVDISPDVEAKRVAYVLDWTVDSVEQSLAQVANVTFDRGSAPRTQADAEAVSKSFELAASEKLSKLPAQAWDSEWTDFATETLDAQATIQRPVEWEHIVYTATRGSLKCMKIIAIIGGATNMNEATAANGGVVALMLKSENGAFDDLAAMTSNQ